MARGASVKWAVVVCAAATVSLLLGSCSSGPLEEPTAKTRQSFVVGSASGCSVELTKVDYDQPGTDTHEFIELHVTWTGTKPSTVSQCGVTSMTLKDDRNSCTAYVNIDMSTVSVPSDGYVLICDPAGTVGRCDVPVSGFWLTDYGEGDLSFFHPSTPPTHVYWQNGYGCNEPNSTVKGLAKEDNNAPNMINIACGTGFTLANAADVTIAQPNPCPQPDGSTCTKDALCQSGHCTNGYCCASASCPACQACDSSGACSGTPLNGTTCDDGNLCTGNDTCSGGTCTGSASAVNGTPCDDGSACTTNDACSGGTCTGTALDCDDNNPCTVDACNPASGCTHTPGGTCSDGDPCTDDVCNAGACVSTPKNCDDGNPCTADSCNATNGCQHVAVADGAACDDKNACTTTSTCSAGTCVGSGAPNCDDNNVCTADSCNPTTGCEHTPTNGSCDDGNPCTAADYCFLGKCFGNFLPNGTACDDGNACTSGDACSGGKCVGSPVAGCGSDGGGTGGSGGSGTDAGIDAGGGTAGSGGTGATGGNGGSGATGNGGNGGSGAVGGSGATGNGGSGATGNGTGGSAGSAAKSGSKGGCGCEVPRRTPGSSGFGTVLLGLALLLLRRRRSDGSL